MAVRLSMKSVVNLEILRREMARANLDTLVASSPESTFYLSGVVDNTYVFLRDRLIIVVVHDGRPGTIIVSGIMEPLARATGWIEDVRTYKEHAVSPVSTLADLLEEKGLVKGRIGIEAKWWTLAFYQELVTRLPNATFIPADDVIQRTRSIKTPEEIKHLKTAAQLTDEAVYAAWRQSHPGDTEREDRRVAEARGGARQPHNVCQWAEHDNYAPHSGRKKTGARGDRPQ